MKNIAVAVADDVYRTARVLEAARVLGCDAVLSEDLGDGEDYAGVRVENPFRGSHTG